MKRVNGKTARTPGVAAARPSRNGRPKRPAPVRGAAGSPNGLALKAVLERLADVPGLIRTDTSMILRIHKQSYTWLREPAGPATPRASTPRGG